MAYRRHTGGHSERTMSMALHVLAPEALRDPPRPAAGLLREPHRHEQERIVEWYQAFAAEADVSEAPDVARQSVLSRLDRGLLSVWEDGGEPVSPRGL